MAKLGVRKTERYLPIGSVVTVIGELDHSILARDPTHAAALSGPHAPQTGLGASIESAVPSAPPLPSGTPFFHPFGYHSTDAAPLDCSSSASTLNPNLAPALLLRKPLGGGPFVVTPLTLHQLHENMSRMSRVYKV